MFLPPAQASRSEQERSNERVRRVKLTSGTALAVKILTLGVPLITTPITITHLGPERYGMWMTIASVAAILGFTDLGIGNGLLTAIAEASGSNDRKAAREYVSSAFVMLLTLATLVGLFFALIYPSIPWHRLFNVATPVAASEAGPSIAIFVACFLLNMPLGVAQRVQWGYQEGFVTNLWAGVGSILSLIGVIFFVALDAGLPWLVLATSAVPLIPTLLNALNLFGRKRPWIRPSLSCVSRAALRKVTSTGILFFVLQVCSVVAFSSDSIIIAQLLGAEAVAQYTVPRQLFVFWPTLLSTVLSPLWPAYAEATARGDVQWIKQVLKKSIYLGTVILVPPVIVLYFGAQDIVSWWTKNQIALSTELLVGLCVWTLMSVVSYPATVFLNGAGGLRFQALTAVFMAPVNLTLSIILTRSIGVPGVIWGTNIAYSVLTLVPTILYIRRWYRRTGQGAS